MARRPRIAQLVHAFVVSQLVYGNSVLAGLLNLPLRHDSMFRMPQPNLSSTLKCVTTWHLHCGNSTGFLYSPCVWNSDCTPWWTPSTQDGVRRTSPTQFTPPPTIRQDPVCVRRRLHCTRSLDVVAHSEHGLSVMPAHSRGTPCHQLFITFPDQKISEDD